MKLSKEAQARREAQVLAYLEENPGWASAVAVSEEIGESRISVARALARLAHKGVPNQKADVRYDSAKRQKIRNVYQPACPCCAPGCRWAGSQGPGLLGLGCV